MMRYSFLIRQLFSPAALDFSGCPPPTLYHSYYNRN